MMNDFSKDWGNVIDDSIFTPQGWQELHGRDLHQTLITHTGRYFWPLDAHVDEIYAEDIAWGLAHECRFGGQIAYHFSVATHSRNLSLVVPERLRKWALVHDASEAYLKDIPRPFKAMIPEYKKYEHSLMLLVASRFGLDPLEEPEELKEYDYRMGHAEMCCLYPSGESKMRALGYDSQYLKELEEYKPLIESVTPVQGYLHWMDKYTELFNE